LCLFKTVNFGCLLRSQTLEGVEQHELEVHQHVSFLKNIPLEKYQEAIHKQSALVL
jgi:hypothetical protein